MTPDVRPQRARRLAPEGMCNANQAGPPDMDLPFSSGSNRLSKGAGLAAARARRPCFRGSAVVSEPLAAARARRPCFRGFAVVLGFCVRSFRSLLRPALWASALDSLGG